MKGEASANVADGGRSDPPVPVAVRWRSGLPGRRLQPPIVAAAGRVLATTFGEEAIGSSAFALDATDGRLIWQQPSTSQWPSWVCFASTDLLVVWSREAGTVARSLDDGRIRWARRELRATGARHEGWAPMMTPDTAGEPLLCMVDLADGATVWQRAMAPGTGVVAADPRRLYLASTTSRGRTRLDAIDRERGETLWRVDWTERPFTPRSTQRFQPGACEIFAAFAIDARVYVSLLDFRFACLDAQSGSVVWDVTLPVAAPTSVVVVDGRLHFNTLSCVCALDAATGEVVFWRDKALPAFFSPGCAFDGHWYTGLENRLDVCSLVDGSPGGGLEIPDALGPPIVFDGRLYVPSIVHEWVYCLSTTPPKRDNE